MSFSVLRKSGTLKGNNWINFTKCEINVGNAMNKTTGIFKAPISGIYEFSFSGRGGIEDQYTEVEVYKNDRFDRKIGDYGWGKPDAIRSWQGGYNWKLKLDENDTVKLWLLSPEDSYNLYFVGKTYMSFSGKLIN